MKTRTLMIVFFVLLIVITCLSVALLYRYEGIDLTAFAEILKRSDAEIVDENNTSIQIDDHETEPELSDSTFSDRDVEPNEEEMTQDIPEEYEQTKPAHYSGEIELTDDSISVYMGENDSIVDLIKYVDSVLLLSKNENSLFGSDKKDIMTFSKVTDQGFELMSELSVGSEEIAYYYVPSGIVFAVPENSGCSLYLYNGINVVLMNTLACKRICAFKNVENGYFALGMGQNNLIIYNLRWDMGIYSTSTISMMPNGVFLGEYLIDEKRYILTSSETSGMIFELYRDAYLVNSYSTVAFNDYSIWYSEGKPYLCLIDPERSKTTLTYYDDRLIECGEYTKKQTCIIATINLKGELYYCSKDVEGFSLYSQKGFGLEQIICFKGLSDAEIKAVYDGKIYVKDGCDLCILNANGDIEKRSTEYESFSILPAANIIAGTVNVEDHKLMVIKKTPE